jgi:hypothetical protein
MFKSLVTAAMIFVAGTVSGYGEETMLEQRGYGTWAFQSFKDGDGFVKCEAFTMPGPSRDTIVAYQTIGSDLLEDLLFFDPVLAFADVRYFELALVSKDGSIDVIEMKFKHERGRFRAHVTDEVYGKIIKSEKFVIVLNGDAISGGWIYPDAFKAVRACRAAAAIMEGMGLGEET